MSHSNSEIIQMTAFLKKKGRDINGELNSENPCGEDSLPILITNERSYLLAVCDGMGGRGSQLAEYQGKKNTHAHFASEAVAKAIEDTYKVYDFDQLTVQELAQNIDKRLKLLPNPMGAGPTSKSSLKGNAITYYPTTLCMAVVKANDPQKIKLFWAGDSRIYAIFEKAMIPLTKDHIKVSEFIYPVSSAPLFRYIALNSNHSSDIETKTFEINNGIAGKLIGYFACSDGLFDCFATPNEFCYYFLKSLYDTLCEKTVNVSLYDNLFNKNLIDKNLKRWSDDVTVSLILFGKSDELKTQIKTLCDQYQNDCLNISEYNENIEKKLNASKELNDKIDELQGKINKNKDDIKTIDVKIQSNDDKIKINEKEKNSKNKNRETWIEKIKEQYHFACDKDNNPFEIHKKLYNELKLTLRNLKTNENNLKEKNEELSKINQELKKINQDIIENEKKEKDTSDSIKEHEKIQEKTKKQMIEDFDQAIKNAKSKESIDKKIEYLDQLYTDFKNLENLNKFLNQTKRTIGENEIKLATTKENINKNKSEKQQKEDKIKTFENDIKDFKQKILLDKEEFNKNMLDISQSELQFFENQQIEYTHGAGIAYQRKKKGKNFFFLEDDEELVEAKKHACDYIDLFEKIKEANESEIKLDQDIIEIENDSKTKREEIKYHNIEIKNLEQNINNFNFEKTRIENQIEQERKVLSNKQDTLGERYITTYNNIIQNFTQGTTK